ncbi:hypothetical protein ACLOJK_023321, partial [Asimina triloba]
DKPNEEAKGRQTIALKANSDDEKISEESTNKVEEEDDEIAMCNALAANTTPNPRAAGRLYCGGARANNTSP